MKKSRDKSTRQGSSRKKPLQGSQAPAGRETPPRQWVLSPLAPERGFSRASHALGYVRETRRPARREHWLGRVPRSAAGRLLPRLDPADSGGDGPVAASGPRPKLVRISSGPHQMCRGACAGPAGPVGQGLCLASSSRPSAAPSEKTRGEHMSFSLSESSRPFSSRKSINWIMEYFGSKQNMNGILWFTKLLGGNTTECLLTQIIWQLQKYV